MKVLILDNVSEIAKEILANEGIEGVILKTPSLEELCKIIPDYEGVIIRNSTQMTKEVLDCAKKLKVIARAGVGVDNIDVDYATEKGVWVINSPDGNTEATAEHTIAMILSVSRKIPQAFSSLKSGVFERPKFMGNEVFGKTLGIIGFGKIGSRVAEIANVLGMQIVVFDPYAKKEAVENLGAEFAADLNKFLPKCDYLTVHVPKNKDTTDMINSDSIYELKKGAKIINCARGGIVNEIALKEALENGHISGAALDVFIGEPEIAKSPFYPFEDISDNLIIVPHLGASTFEAQIKVAKDVTAQTATVLNGGKPATPVNKLK